MNCIVSGRGVTCGHTFAPSRQTLLVQPERLEMLAGRRREQRVGERAADAGLPLVHVGVGALLTGGDEHHALARVARREEQRLDFVGLGEAARHRLAVDAAVREREAGGEARRAGRERLPHERGHLLDLVGGGRALVGGVAHHVEPQRGVADVGGEVERASPAGATDVEVLGERLEVPRDPGDQRGRIHVLDVLERARR